MRRLAPSSGRNQISSFQRVIPSRVSGAPVSVLPAVRRRVCVKSGRFNQSIAGLLPGRVPEPTSWPRENFRSWKEFPVVLETLRRSLPWWSQT